MSARTAIAAVVVIAAAGGSASLAPAPARAAFERPPLDAWSAALGGLVALAEGGAFGNAASLGAPLADADPGSPWFRAPGGAAAFDVARPFGLPELAEAQAGWSRAGAWGAALGGRRFGTDAYAEVEARLAVARAWGAGAAGLASRFLQVRGTGFRARRSVAVDAGFRAEPEPGFVVAAAAEAVLGEVPGDPEGRGRRTALGAARSIGPLRVSVEAQRTEDAPLGLLIGLEARLPRGLRLAAGARERPGSASAGVSLPLPGGRVTVAGTWVPPLGTTLRLGIRLGR